jgi:hypothetical protein
VINTLMRVWLALSQPLSLQVAYEVPAPPPPPPVWAPKCKTLNLRASVWAQVRSRSLKLHLARVMHAGRSSRGEMHQRGVRTTLHVYFPTGG